MSNTNGKDNKYKYMMAVEECFFCFHVVQFKDFFVYYFSETFLSDLCFTNIFSLTAVCIFILLTVTYAEQKF